VKQSSFQIGVSLTMITHRLLVPNKGTQLRVFEQFIENNHDRGSWALHGELRQVQNISQFPIHLAYSRHSNILSHELQSIDL
jgi:hypothetical protein